MPVITRINGIPLFSSIQGALRWGRFNRLKGGYHVHYWEGEKGYMGGNNHAETTKRRPMKFDPVLAARQKANNIAPTITPIQPAQPEQPEQIVRPVRTVRPVRPEELEQPVRSTTRRTTSSGSGYKK